VIGADASEIPRNGPAALSGPVGLGRLVGGEQTEKLDAYLVRFEVGGRNLPHTHSFDQALHILEGEGIVATEASEQRVHAGDIVVIPPGEPHWHGATGESAMAHLAFGVPGSTDVVGGERYVPSG